MTTITRHRGLTGLAISLIAALALAVPVHSAWAAGNPNPRVLPPNSLAYGKTYGEWSAAWWQFAFRIPYPVNPLFDTTGADCSVGQSGPVWFLAGVFSLSGSTNLSATRTCTVPAGKALFFPVVNAECDNFFPPVTPPMDEAQLRSLCQSEMNAASNMSAEVDGTSIQGLSNVQTTNYGATSPVFSVTLPDDNILQAEGLGSAAAPGTYSPLVADGVYLMLAPLPAGRHTLHFHGEIPAFNFTLDVTYHLKVNPTVT